LRDIAKKYYGTTDLRTFQKDSPIYKMENIRIINDRAAEGKYPFFNFSKESEGADEKNE
jgi:hypothetical protein